MGPELIQYATEIKVRAERRCGELLRVTAERGERATKAGNVNPGTVKVSNDATPSPPTLADMGLTRDESSRYQQLAAMPAGRRHRSREPHEQQRNSRRAPQHSDL